MPARRFTLSGLFFLVAFCALLLAFLVPLFRQAASEIAGGNMVADLAFSADGSTVAAHFADGTVRVWRTSDQSLVAALNTGAIDLEGRIALSADGAIVAVCSGNSGLAVNPGGLEIWDVAAGKQLAAHPAAPEARIEFSPTKAILAVRSLDAPLTLYDCSSGADARVRTIESSDAADTFGQAMTFSDDGETLAAASFNRVDFWDLETGERRASLADEAFGMTDEMTLSAGGKRLAAKTVKVKKNEIETSLKVWDVPGARLMSELAHSESLNLVAFRSADALAFLPDGRTLVLASGEMRAWDVETGQRRMHPLGADISAELLAAPRRGNCFAVSDGETIVLWDAATFAPRQTLWLPASEGPSPLLPVAALVLLMTWALHRAKQLTRTCSTCGQQFTPAGAADPQAECPACRLKTLADDERTKEQKRQAKERRIGWIALTAIILGLPALFASALQARWGLQSWLLAYLITTALIVIGVPGALIACVLPMLYLKRRRLLREKNIVQLVERAAGAPGETLRSGPLVVWCAEGTTLGGEIEGQLAATAEHLQTLTGQAPSLGPWLRCFVLREREHFEQALKGAGFAFDKRFDFESFYLSAPWRVGLFNEGELRRKASDPLASVRNILCYHLAESLGIAWRTSWLCLGLARVAAHREDAGALARVNRHMLSALAAGRTLDAGAFFAPTPLIGFRLGRPPKAELPVLAEIAMKLAQYESVMQFLCGAGSTPARRLAFQNFLRDPRRRKRPSSALAEHFGRSPEALLADWRQWVLQQGVGEHAPPSREHAERLLKGPVATIRNLESPTLERLRAIRQLGRDGYVVGVEALIDVVRQGPADLAEEAIWALETIAGRSFGKDAAQWDAWRASLPASATLVGDACRA